MSASQDHTLEADLHWPPGTLALLRQAFARRQSRHDAWDSAEQSAATQMAARVYKRGSPRQQKIASVLPGAINTVSTAELAKVLAEAKFLVVDAGFAAAWPELVPNVACKITASESAKTLASVATILRAGRAQPHWVVVAGGTVSDIAMFAASLCAAQVTLVPTTLLAMIDAAIGGKTGVNFAPYGKNQLGTFYAPDKLLLCADLLGTLPPREFACGGAEAIKHALLAGDAQLLMALPPIIARRDVEALRPHLQPLAQYKLDLCRKDPFEHGPRAWLNFGHTFGHALESLSNLKHGEAVALGMLFEMQLAATLGLLPATELARARRAICDSAILPSRAKIDELLAKVTWTDVAALMLADKKNIAANSTEINFTILRAIGKPYAEGEAYTLPVQLDVVEQIYIERRYLPPT